MGLFDKYIEKNRKYWYDFPDGTLKGEYETNEVGNKHGVEKLYHENGQLASQLNFSNGIQDDGEVLSYHKDGSKARKVIILNNKFNGEFFEWYENGNLKIQGTYVDGKILGIYKSWDIDNVKQSDFFKIVPNSYTKGYDYEEKIEIEVNWLQDIGPVYSRNINYYGSDAEKLNILSYTPNTIDEEEYISIFCISSEESINIINHIINLNGGMYNYNKTDREDWNYYFKGHLFDIGYRNILDYDDNDFYVVELNRIKHEFISFDDKEILHGIHQNSKIINSMINGLNSLVYNFGEMVCGDGRFCYTSEGSHIVSYWSDPQKAVDKFKSIIENYPEKLIINYDDITLLKKIRKINFLIQIETDDFKITLGKGTSLYQINLYIKDKITLSDENIKDLKRKEEKQPIDKFKIIKRNWVNNIGTIYEDSEYFVNDGLLTQGIKYYLNLDVFIPEEVFYSPKNRTDFIYQVFSSSTKAKKVASNIIRQNGGFSKFKKEPNSFSDYERIGEYKYSSIQIFSHYIGKSMVVVALRYVPVRMHRYSSYVVGILEINNSLSENNKTIKFNNITLRKAVKEWLEDDKKAEATYGHISDWDTSELTDMNELFLDAHTFNEPIGNWDVSNVTIMRSLFAYASAFNQDISSWDVGSVTDMSYMFTGTPFNQHIGNWDVSNVTDMQEMFWGDTKFNQPIGNWDVSNVTNMESMFRDALSFNQDLSNWDVNIYSGKINGESAYIDFSNETPQWTLQKPNFTKTALEDEGGVIHLQKEGNYFYYTNENGEKDQFIADKLLVESPEDNKLEFIVRDEIEEALDSKYIIFVTKGDEVFRIIDLPEIDDSEFENSVGVLTDSDKPLKSSEEAVQFVKNIKTISFNDIGVIADYNKAIADYTKAIELEPNKSRAYYNRGFLKHEFNDDTGAIADYNIAIRLDPNYADAYYNRGLSRYLLGDKNGRDRDFLKAQQLGGDGFYVHE